MLGYVHELKGWHGIERYPGAEETPGVVIYRWEAPLFFANAGIFRQQIRKLVVERKPRWVVLQCEAITDIDVTAADMLKGLDRELNEQGHPHGLRRAARHACRTAWRPTACSASWTASTSSPRSSRRCATSPRTTRDSDDAPHRWVDALEDEDES